MKIKKMLSLILALVMVLSLAACGGSGTTDAPAAGDAPAAEPEVKEEVTQITYLTHADFVSTLEPIVAKYKEETGVEVKLEGYSSNDLMDVIEVKISSGTTDYDVIAVDAPLVAAYVNRGYLAPMDSYYAADEVTQMTDVSVSGGSVAGVFYAPPMNTSSICMYYNTALLKEAGIEIGEVDPADRMNWDEVLDMAKKTVAAVDPDGTEGVYGVEFRQVSRVYQMNCIPNSLGGKNIGDDGFTVDGILNSQEWIDGMTWYQNLVKDKISSRGIASTELRNMFAAGKIVFLIDTTSLTAFCHKNGLETFDLMPVPEFTGYEEHTATGTGSWHFGINHASEKKDAAADFIKWMSIGEGADLWYEGYNILPTKVAILQEMEKDPNLDKALKIAAYEAQHTAVLRAMTPGFSEYQTIMNAAWEDVRNGEDVTETLNYAVEQLKPALEAYKK